MSILAANNNNDVNLDYVFSRVSLPSVQVSNRAEHDEVIRELDRILAKNDSGYLDNVVEQHLLADDHHCSRRNSQLSTRTRSRQPSILESALHDVNEKGIVATILHDENIEADEEGFGSFPADAPTEPHANVLSYVTSHERRDRTETVDSYASEAESRFGTYDLAEGEIDLNHPHIAYGEHYHDGFHSEDESEHQVNHPQVSPGAIFDQNEDAHHHHEEDQHSHHHHTENHHHHHHTENHQHHEQPVTVSVPVATKNIYDEVPEEKHENHYEEIREYNHGPHSQAHHHHEPSREIKSPISEDTYDRLQDYDSVSNGHTHHHTNGHHYNNIYQVDNVKRLQVNGNGNVQRPSREVKVVVRDNFNEDYLVPIKSKVTITDKPKVSQLLSYQIKNAEKIGSQGIFTYYRPYFTVANHSNFPEITVGGPTQATEERVLLLVGESKSGKTSFLYSLLNYLYDVQKEQAFRLAMELPGSFENINNRIISYRFNNTIFPYTVTVIDTPGIELTSTPKLMGQFIKHKLDTTHQLRLDALVPVVKASSGKAHRQVLAHYEHIQYLFGDDLRTNLLPVVTFAKGPHRSLDLTSLWSLKLPFTNYFIVNNLGFLPNDGSVTGLNHSVLFKHGVVNLEAFFDVLDSDTIPLLLAKSNHR